MTNGSSEPPFMHTRGGENDQKQSHAVPWQEARREGEARIDNEATPNAGPEQERLQEGSLIDSATWRRRGAVSPAQVTSSRLVSRISYLSEAGNIARMARRS